MDPSITKEGKIYSDLCGRLPVTSNKVNKYIYAMHLYNYIDILRIAIKTRCDKEMIQAFTELTTDLKIHGIKPGFHFMDNKASTLLKMEMTTMNIKYQLVPPSNYRTNNTYISIQMFKNHFLEGICIVDKDFCLQLCDRLIHQATISPNLLRQ